MHFFLCEIKWQSNDQLNLIPTKGKFGDFTVVCFRIGRDYSWLYQHYMWRKQKSCGNLRPHDCLSELSSALDLYDAGTYLSSNSISEHQNSFPILESCDTQKEEMAVRAPSWLFYCMFPRMPAWTYQGKFIFLEADNLNYLPQ